MAKKVLNKRKSENISLMEIVERLAMVVPQSKEDCILMNLSEDFTHKYAERQAMKSITNKKEMSFMTNNKNKSTKGATAMQECAITSTITDTTSETAMNILRKVAVVTINMDRVGNREVSEVISKYCRDINSAVRELNSGVIEHCKSLGDYSSKDALFTEVATEYLSKFEADVLQTLVIQQLASVGQKEAELDNKSKEELIKASVQLYIINQEISRKQFLSTMPPSEKTLTLFHKLNDAVPTELSFDIPTNAFQASEVIEKLLNTPTANMLNKAFKLAVENGKELPMEKLQAKSRKEISTLIDAFEDLIPASEQQLNMIASILKQLNEVYVAENYSTLSKAKATRGINSLNQRLLVKLSDGSISLEEAKKLSFDKVNEKIAQYRQESKMKFFDNDAKEKLGSILDSLGL